MRYPEEVIEEVRARNDILDVISGYVSLKRKGASYFGLCPFHNEKTGSFSVSRSKQIYYCFGCGAGGNVISFIMQYENLTFPEAVQFLAKRAGVRKEGPGSEVPASGDPQGGCDPLLPASAHPGGRAGLPLSQGTPAHGRDHPTFRSGVFQPAAGRTLPLSPEQGLQGRRP